MELFVLSWLWRILFSDTIFITSVKTAILINSTLDCDGEIETCLNNFGVQTYK